MLEPCYDPHGEKKSDAEVIGEITKVSNAVGFFLYCREDKVDKRIRILRIAKDEDSQAVLPSVSAVADGSYPLVDTLTLHLRPDAPPSAFEFAKFATGPKAVKVRQSSSGCGRSMN